MMGWKLRLRPVTLLLASFLFYGCTSTTPKVDCSNGVGQNGCVPGTTQYENMMEQKKEAASAAAVDDTRCLAFGARGTTGYAECRRRAVEDTKFFDSKF